jgi:hypothetical protein
MYVTKWEKVISCHMEFSEDGLRGDVLGNIVADLWFCQSFDVGFASTEL